MSTLASRIRRRGRPSLGTLDRGAATVASELVKQLRADIIRGELAPAQKLRVDFVCTRYSVGSSPAREALSQLSAEGLVTRHDQRGFFVAEITLDNLVELIKTRQWLEERALRESIANRTEAWEEEIVLSFHRLMRVSRWVSTEPGQPPKTNCEWENRHRRFHRALIAGCTVRPLLRFCSELSDQLERYRQLAAEAIYPFESEEAEHRRIMELVIDGNSDEAVATLLRHYDNTLRVVRSSPLLLQK